jgi:hypothetical protein
MYGWNGFVEKNPQFAGAELIHEGGSQRRYADRITHYKLVGVNPDIPENAVKEAVKTAWQVGQEWWANKLERFVRLDDTTYAFTIRDPYKD